jgi:hypothetical protein
MRRFTACKISSCTKPHLPYIANTDVHSGDERELDCQYVRYGKYSLLWRSSPLEEFLRSMDAVHMSTRFKPDGKPRAGNVPVYRVRSSRVDDFSDVPTGLPENYYCPEYLMTLTDWERQKLDVQPSIPLEIDEGLRAIIEKYKNCTGRHSIPGPG